MNHRDWLACAAAASLLGALPAAAQAPRSLFEASATGSVPVGMSFGGTPASLRPSLFTPSEPPAPESGAKSAALPSEAPLTERPVTEKAVAAKIVVQPSILPPLPPRRPAGLPGARQLASLNGADLPAERAAPGSAAEVPAAPGASGEPPAAGPAKPLTRAEKLRALREAKKQAALDAAAPPVTAAPPTFTTNPLMTLFGAAPAQPSGERLPAVSGRPEIDALVSRHAKLNGVPESLVHRIIVRESRYNPRAVGRGGAMGLMQIKTATARGLGYTGGPAGLLDAETNITYAVKYLAGAWRVSGGSHDRAVGHYASGYYYAARRMGHVGGRRGQRAAEAPVSTPAQTPSFLSLFSQQQASAR